MMFEVFKREELIRLYDQFKKNTISESIPKHQRAIEKFRDYGDPMEWISPFELHYGKTYEEQKEAFLWLYTDKSEVTQDFIKEAIDTLLDIAKPNAHENIYLWFPRTKKYRFVKEYDISTRQSRRDFKQERQDALGYMVCLGVISSDDIGIGMRSDGYCPIFTFDADTQLEKFKVMIQEYEADKQSFLIKKNGTIKRETHWRLAYNPIQQKLYEIKNAETAELHSMNDDKYAKFWKYLFENKGVQLKKAEIKRILNIRNLKISDYLKNSKITKERKSRYFPKLENNRILLFRDIFIEL